MLHVVYYRLVVSWTSAEVVILALILLEATTCLEACADLRVGKDRAPLYPEAWGSGGIRRPGITKPAVDQNGALLQILQLRTVTLNVHDTISASSNQAVYMYVCMSV